MRDRIQLYIVCSATIQLRKQRRELADALGGRAVLIGWTATASIADFLPTSLHPRCPAAVVLGGNKVLRFCESR